MAVLVPGLLTVFPASLPLPRVAVVFSPYKKGSNIGWPTLAIVCGGTCFQVTLRVAVRLRVAAAVPAGRPTSLTDL